MAETIIPTAAAPEPKLETMVERMRRRARLVLALRLGVLVRYLEKVKPELLSGSRFDPEGVGQRSPGQRPG